MFQIQGSLLAKSFAVMLLAVSYLVPSWQPASRTCTGPNCPRQQCTRPATIVIESPAVTSVPQFFDAGGVQWVLVREPVTDQEPEDLMSPLAEEPEAAATDVADEVKAEVEDDVQTTTADASPQAEGGKEKEDQPATAASTRDQASAKTAATTRTRAVWMRASDARAAGLIPTASSGGGGGFGSSGSGIAMAAPVDYRSVSYQQSYGCTGNSVNAFYGQSTQQNACVWSGQTIQVQSAPQTFYRTRRAWFPNLFPRLRGLR